MLAMRSEAINLRARHALLTGGTGTVGSLLARRLLTAGVAVTTVGRRPCKPFAAGHVHIVADLSLPEAVPQIVNLVEQELDILVALAATHSPGRLASLTPRQLEDVMRVKVWAPGLLAYAFCPGMAQRGWGRLVLVGGVTGHRPIPGFIAGAIANSSVKTLTMALSQEWRGTGVTVNCVTPGAIQSNRLDATRRLLNEGREGELDSLEKAPVLQPKALVDSLVFLLSQNADAISGTDVVVDAGLLSGLSL